VPELTPAQANIKRWRDEPRGILQFAWEQFHFTPDPWQEEALLAFASSKPEHRRVSLQACVGPGKTAVLAIAGWWFLGVQGDAVDHPQGAAFAITGDNLRDNLWKEFAKWQNQSRYLRAAFTLTARRIFANDHPETWFLSARTWSKTANADEMGTTLSGLHSKYVLAMGDESGAIPTAILRAAEQALAQAGGGFAKLIQAGNPVSLEGMLYAAANELRHLWHVIRVTGDPEDPNAWVHNPRVGDEPKQWSTEQIATYGRENPWVKSFILGQFPPASLNALLSIEDVEAAMARHYRIDAYEWAQKRIGVDVARFGDDRTVLFPRQGVVAFKPVVMRVQNTMQIAARIAQGITLWAPDGDIMVFVDDSGHWGHGAVDALTTARYPVQPVIGEAPATDPRYYNKRAEMAFRKAQWVKDGGALPKVPKELVAELTAATYTFHKGKLMIEPKDQIKKRLGRSPDLSDALDETFALPEMPRGLRAIATSQHTAAHGEEDPWR
jgi:hypothetical protein